MASKFDGMLSGRLACIQKADSNCAIWSSVSFIMCGSSMKLDAPAVLSTRELIL
uniref:Uncharacterized protein n=1 Tax=Rhizophora mucronata TaxID=61149 RepID=A0A2P2QNB2_RHIMU